MNLGHGKTKARNKKGHGPYPLKIKVETMTNFSRLWQALSLKELSSPA